MGSQPDAAMPNHLFTAQWRSGSWYLPAIVPMGHNLE
jgi:hypothetical protein